jgi:hypothetical protein
MRKRKSLDLEMKIFLKEKLKSFLSYARLFYNCFDCCLHEKTFFVFVALKMKKEKCEKREKFFVELRIVWEDIKYAHLGSFFLIQIQAKTTFYTMPHKNSWGSRLQPKRTSLSHSFSHSFCEFYNENFCWVEKKGETNFYDDMNNNKLIISFLFKGESWILRVFEMIYLWDHQKKKCLFEFLKNILLIPCWAITCTYIALFTILYRSSCRILLLFPMWMSHTSNSQEMKYVFLWLYDSSTFHFWIYLAQASSTSQSKIDLSLKNFHNISLLAFLT